MTTEAQLEFNACRSLFHWSREASELAKQAQARCHALGAKILYPGHALYPSCFSLIEKPPEFISVIGSIEALDPSRCVSIVGAREASRRALDWIDNEIAQYLELCPQTILVSGGARGVDQRVHAAALRQTRPTVAFLPSGFDHVYPSDFQEWVAPITAAGGAVVSPYAPHQEIRRAHFEGRNRLIAALGRMLLVVEARRQSGSLMTARLAAELSKTVASVPSFPSELQARGSMDLIFDGAFPVRDAMDLALLDGSSGLLPGSTKRPRGRNRKKYVGQPHGDHGGQIPFARGALGCDVQDIVSDDQSQTDHSAAGLHVTAVADSAKAGTYGSE